MERLINKQGPEYFQKCPPEFTTLQKNLIFGLMYMHANL